MSDTVEMKLDGLDKLLKALKIKEPVAKVGVLGDKNSRSVKLTFEQITGAKGKVAIETNASIGYDHEFGDPTRNLPQRSFLRMPITEKWANALESAQAFNEDTLKEVIKIGSVVPWMKKAAVIAHGVVLEAFATGGFGKWPSHAPGYTNNTGMILVDTTQLRDSITWEVKE